jgi:hypothetical protein
MDPQLWACIRTVRREHAINAAVAHRTQRDLYNEDLYDEYVGPYFAERCSQGATDPRPAPALIGALWDERPP